MLNIIRPSITKARIKGSNSKIKIGRYDISKNNSFYEIKILFSISTDLLRMVLTKAVSVVALKYRCNNCVLEVDGTEKTICLHY